MKMNNSNMKKSFIQKETQENIRRFFDSNVTFRTNSPASPSIELDPAFSRLLKEKRNQKNVSNVNHPSDADESGATVNLVEMCQEVRYEEPYPTGSHSSFMDNSMKIGDTADDFDVDDDSFLEMERQCQFEERRQRILEAEADNTQLSDIEPPPEMWEDSLIGQAPSLQHLRTEDDFIQLSPMRMVGVTRPSTIVEETSSQCNSTGEDSRNSRNSTEKNVSKDSPESQSSSSPSSVIYLSSSDTSIIEKISPLKLVQETPTIKCIPPTPIEAKKKRETLVFQKRKYKFFKDENDPRSPLVNINSPRTPATASKDLISLEQSPLISCQTPDRDQFNDTIEAVEFFMEKGKRLLQQTPQAKSGMNRTLFETPLFSCKRTRMLSEMAAAEMLPIPKRGPLFDLDSSPDPATTPNARK